MNRPSQILTLAFVLTACLTCQVLQGSFASDSGNSHAAQGQVVLAKLSRPDYPLFARRTWVSGDVTLSLQIRRDGSIESAVIVSGPPLLQQAALESAQRSQFECLGCTEEITQYFLVYTFQLFGPDCHPTTSGPSSNIQQCEKPRAQVIQSENKVTVIDEGGMCEGVFSQKVRSAKCLYLWRCVWRT